MMLTDPNRPSRVRLEQRNQEIVLREPQRHGEVLASREEVDPWDGLERNHAHEVDGGRRLPKPDPAVPDHHDPRDAAVGAEEPQEGDPRVKGVHLRGMHQHEVAILREAGAPDLDEDVEEGCREEHEVRCGWDALLAWHREEQGETHGVPPEEAAAQHQGRLDDWHAGDDVRDRDVYHLRGLVPLLHEQRDVVEVSRQVLHRRDLLGLLHPLLVLLVLLLVFGHLAIASPGGLLLGSIHGAGLIPLSALRDCRWRHPSGGLRHHSRHPGLQERPHCCHR
mmetsp:Transcript_38449/g.107103  ORF Transcript_38449/g.107103 Transcript_38449/m.107103 type:complete len:279 (-) Transcript_38449:584-1420(-)